MIELRNRLLAGAASLVLAMAVVPAANAQTEKSFSIPAGSLEMALESYADQAELDLIYPSSLVAGLTTSGVSTTGSPDEVLKQLLRGSGLESRTGSDGAIAISRRQSNIVETTPIVFQEAPVVPEQRLPDEAGAGSTNAELRQDTVVVVGSQIVGARVDGALPVITLGEDQFAGIGGLDGDDILRSIPQMGDVGFNATENVSGGVNSARGDVASINLRALGTGNTLTLLNGRRMVNHPGTQSENLVPVVTVNANAIPVTGLNRVEVLLDGASALYGSDAVAGVVNTVLKRDLDGVSLGFRVSQEEDVDSTEYHFNFDAGHTSDDDRFNISLFGAYTDRDPVYASEREFSANSDNRDLLPEDWAGDTNFRNDSNNSPWGAFTLLDPVSLDTVSLSDVTNGSGGFHVQPDDFPGCRVDLGNGLCIDDNNSSGSVAERYNTNAERTVSNGVERLNLFLTSRYEFSPAIEIYGEAGYYHSDSYAERAGSAQLTAGFEVIPASNYYNPFGPAGSANRIEGIGTPDEGYAVLLRRYRLVDAGPRKITVENDSWRLLGGARGDFAGWDWDSAFLVSEAETDDTTIRTSNTLFAEALALDTPNAYNPFNGGGLPISNSGDTTPSDHDTINSFLVPVSRVSTTKLSLVDFKVSKADLLSIWSGDIGAAFGVEFRHEEYEDDRDPRLDGTINFINEVTGEETSDVMGSSPTLDSKGDRDVFSAYAEASIPLVSEEMNVPLVQALDLQLAARYEDYDLFGAVTKPKVALSWRPSDFLLLRTAWSQGFKAPNLQQQFDRSLERVNNRPDYIRCEADLRAGRIASFSDCEQTIAVVSQRQGSTDLGPEESESFSAGLVLDSPFIPEIYGKLQFTVDYWSIEQEDVVGIFGDDNHLINDYLQRVRGSSNTSVVRADPTAEDIADFEGTGIDPVGQILFVADNYKNLLPREVDGIDYGVYYNLDDTSAGDFSFRLNVAQLLTFSQSIAPLEAEILAAQAAGEISEIATLSGLGDLVRQDGRPEWRWSLSTTWSNGPFSAGWFTSYVDDVLNTSATNDETGEFWTVDSLIRHNAYIDYKFFNETDYPVRMRFGVRNIFDEDPPLADEALGYLGSLHSPNGRTFYLSAKATF